MLLLSFGRKTMYISSHFQCIYVGCLLYYLYNKDGADKSVNSNRATVGCANL